jgi:hypothetical protein
MTLRVLIRAPCGGGGLVNPTGRFRGPDACSAGTAHRHTIGGVEWIDRFASV